MAIQNGAVRRTESGSATIQTLLLLPGIVLVLLFFFQLTLLLHAKLVVNYASFCAVRAASVLGAERLLQLERRGTVEASGDEDLDRVRRAATISLSPISPVLSTTLPFLNAGPAGGSIEPLTALSATLRFSDNLRQRERYAAAPENTTVTIHVAERDHNKNVLLTTTTVEYHYYLAIPFVGRLMGERYPGEGLLGGYYFYAFRESYGLPVDGRPTFPEPQRLLFEPEHAGGP